MSGFRAQFPLELTKVISGTISIYISCTKCLKTWKSGCVVIRLPSHVQLFATPWTAAHRVSLYFTISRSLLRLIESVMPSNHLILCRPLLLMPSIFPSIGVFSNESALHTRWPTYWSISPSNEYSGLISFRCDLFAVLGTLKSLLQNHNSKVSILQHSAFLQSNSHIHTWVLKKP